ncbi:MAG: hypothetical protein WCG66_04930 [bacterium]
MDWLWTSGKISTDDQGRQLARAARGSGECEMELRSVEAIVGALNAAEVRYLIVGGLAVNAHGYQRMTVDVDLVVQLKSDNLLAGLRALQSLGYAPRIPVNAEEFADPAIRDTWRSEKGMLVFQLHSDIHRTTPIDIFVYEPFDFDTEYEQAVSEAIATGLDVRIVRLEALLKMKRAANRLKDLVDLDALQKIDPYKK